ncbi:MAG: hypothetical protein AB1725_05365 [Armatimonadota bacterium]
MSQESVYLLFTAVVVAALSWFLSRYIHSVRSKAQVVRQPLLIIEFWVYARNSQRPTQEELTGMLMGEGKTSIGTAEALVFTDIRFQMGTVKREANAMLFQPGALLEPDAALPPDLAERIEQTQAVHTVRFVAEPGAFTEREESALRLATWVALATADLADGTVIVDIETQSAYTPEQFRQAVEHHGADAFALHVATRWWDDERAAYCFTRGLNKIGQPDIVAEDVPTDFQTLATHLVGEYAEHVWKTRDPSPTVLEVFGSRFLLFTQPADALLSLHRGAWVRCGVNRLEPSDGSGE